VRDNLTGTALCEYEQLFAQVKKRAPEQQLVLTTQVRDIGVTRLESDRAALLVFVDQRSTRADENKTVGGVAHFAIDAERHEDRWRITNFDMFGQTLADGQAVPEC
jgi:Mce-associated membrane protein